MFKIKLDEELAITLRNQINEHQDISLKVTYQNKNAWNSICSILDRIDDIVIYLNQLELNTGKWDRCAFDFFEFINQSEVLIECISKLAEIYKVNIYDENAHFFNHKYINNKIKKEYEEKGILEIKETDLNYFKYLRSLSSIHPIDTTRHQIYMSDTLEVSPYVIWNNKHIYEKEQGDLIIVAYSEIEDFKHIFIKIDEVFNFVTYSYNLINKIVHAIKEYNSQVIISLKNRPIKNIVDFENYNDYLNNLIKESEERCPSLTSEIIEAKEIIRISMTDKRNELLYQKYCNAIKYAIETIHNNLQSMKFNFSNDKDNLIFDLLTPTNTYTERDYHYQLEKINYLKGDYGDPYWGKKMLRILLPILRKYVVITDEDFDYNIFDYELYVLSRVALYFNALDNDSLINKLIPNNKKYRLF